MSEKTKVSIIIPCYNYAHFLEDAVGSVLDQTYSNWECLIIDDGSTDNTQEVASKLAGKDPRIKYVYQENMGLAASRNRGFALSQGEYIKFLDTDDMIHPLKLQEQVEILDHDPFIGVSYTNYQTFKENLSNLTGRYSHLILGDKPLEDFLFKWERGLSIPIHAALFRKSVFVKNGKPFVEELMAKEDWVMWVKLAVDGITFSFLDKDYCYYRGHQHSQTTDVKSMFSYFIKAVFIISDMIPNSYHEKFIDSSLTHAEITYLNIISRATLFWDSGKGFNPGDALFENIRIQGKLSFQLSYDLTSIGMIDQLRFDPLEGYLIEAKLNIVKYLTKSNEVNELDLSKVTSNGTALEDDYILFETFDPIFFLPISGELQKIEISGEITVLENQQIELIIAEKEQVIAETKLVLEEKEQVIAEVEQVMSEYKKEIAIAKFSHAIGNMQSQLSAQAQEIDQKNQEINLLNSQLEQNSHELNLVVNSASWRITAPLRTLKAFLRQKLPGQQGKYSHRDILKITNAENVYNIQSSQVSRLSLALYLLRIGIRNPLLTLKLAHPRRIKNAILYFAKDKGNLIQLSKKYQDYYGETAVEEIDNNSKELINKAMFVDCKIDVLIFPVIDWSFRHQRPQHFALELGKLGYRVFYFSTMPLTDSKYPFAIMDNPGENVFVCRLSNDQAINDIYQNLMPIKVRDIYHSSLLSFMGKLGIKKSVSLINHPYWKPLVDMLPGTIIGYDCMDHHRGFHKDCSEIPEYEIELINDADFIVTSSLTLHDRINKYRPNIIIRNGCEYSHFTNKIDSLPKDERPVVGYVGAIADWFDIDLIIYAAKKLKDWRFVLVGSTVGCNTDAASKQSNIEFVGEITYDKVPYYVESFDVCLIPFKINELTKSTNPVKVYEYLCAGKPVVSTAIPEILMIKDKVFIGNNPEAFVKQIQKAFSKKDNPELVKEWQYWAYEQDWSMRVADLDKIIKSQPLMSIVILTYNNLEFTKACLDSLDRFTYYPNYEVIIVDNASTDGSQKYIKNFIDKRPGWQLISNKHNLGFAAGNNVGINSAKGEYIVLLNNDTFVTPGWLKNLTRPFIRFNDLGLTGPVTNNIGNEARIEMKYTNMEEMMEKARDFTHKNNRKLIFINNIAFFCVAIKREVIEKVGLLDEQFEIGFFEDDDYCRRASENKYRIAIVEDCFVHHHLNASFDNMNSAKRKYIFDQNKERYEAKWGKWQPHSYRG